MLCVVVFGVEMAQFTELLLELQQGGKRRGKGKGKGKGPRRPGDSGDADSLWGNCWLAGLSFLAAKKCRLTPEFRNLAGNPKV